MPKPPIDLSARIQGMLELKLLNAETDGLPSRRISAKELHDLAYPGGYPGPNHRMAMCCHAMDKAKRPGDRVVDERKTDGPHFTIEYRLPRS